VDSLTAVFKLANEKLKSEEHPIHCRFVCVGRGLLFFATPAKCMRDIVIRFSRTFLGRNFVT
jgi:hypothetical protein